MSACPFCGCRISASRGEELAIALARAKEYGTHMVTVGLDPDLPNEKAENLLFFGRAILEVVRSFPPEIPK